MSRWASLVLALLFALSLTAGARAQSSVESVFADIDAYWAATFAEAGIGYYSPLVAVVDGVLETGCGPIDPSFGPGAYCALDQTLYFAPSWFGNLDFATENAAFLLVMSHEWSHHIQVLLGISDISILEPQADCLSGVYLANAEERGLVSPGDLAQALRIVNSAGDVPWLDPGAFPHGPGTLRSIAFIGGQSGGLEGCGLVF
ncbi:MAG: neutral zinc metallopeptidase [Chloroflexota bacterium]|nr:neutral zinc metallopeptidase [Chloroflexota bacterium]